MICQYRLRRRHGAVLPILSRARSKRYGNFAHSYRNASTGSKRDATTAGHTPKNTPTPTETVNAVITAQPGTLDGRLGNSALTNNVTRIEHTIPITPPAPVSVTASLKNWITMSRRRAPTAFRTPISRVRSVTLTNIMFITDRKSTRLNSSHVE